MQARKTALQNLNEIVGFKQRAKLFIHDLRHYGKDKRAQGRLDGISNKYFLGLPYFDTRTVEMLLELPVGRSTLGDRLLKMAEKADENGVVCASHDLAPIFEAAIEIKWAQVNSELQASKKALAKLVAALLPLLPNK